MLTRKRRACQLPEKEAFAVSPVPRHPRSAGGEDVRYFLKRSPPHGRDADIETFPG